jgi:hypothetical protein
MNPDFEQLAQLISGVSESLHREMHAGFTRVNERFDLIETRMNRQSALIQTSSRWIKQRIHNIEQKQNGHV